MEGESAETGGSGPRAAVLRRRPSKSNQAARPRAICGQVRRRPTVVPPKARSATELPSRSITVGRKFTETLLAGCVSTHELGSSMASLAPRPATDRRPKVGIPDDQRRSTERPHRCGGDLRSHTDASMQPGPVPNAHPSSRPPATDAPRSSRGCVPVPWINAGKRSGSVAAAPIRPVQWLYCPSRALLTLVLEDGSTEGRSCPGGECATALQAAMHAPCVSGRALPAVLKRQS